MGFIDTMRAQGFAVESICQVLRNQGVQVAARTYRAWKAPGRQVAARTISDAVVADALLGARTCWDGRPTPEELVRAAQDDRAAAPTVAWPLRTAPWTGSCVSWACTACAGASSHRPRPPAPTQQPVPETCWTATSPRQRPTGSGLPTSPTCATWAAMVYVAFVVDVYAQRIVGWHAMSTRPAELVLLPLRMAAWARGQQGHPIVRGELVHHSDAGSQGGFNWSSQHLDSEEVAMGSRQRRAADRARASGDAVAGSAAGGATEHRQRFWAAIAGGLSSEDAGGGGRRVAAGRVALVP